MNILAKVAYKGTNFQGWQRQKGVKSIQGEIEKILSRILNAPTVIFASGRTDAGVHARCQYFHFEVKNNVDLAKLRYSANSLLGKDIQLLSFTIVPDGFHARFSAVEKHYSYTFYVGENDPFNNEFKAHFVQPLDLKRFTKAVMMFNGTFNFNNFTSKPLDEQGFIRSVKVSVKQTDNVVRIDFYGNGFMRYMIRFMVGVAKAIGEGKQDFIYLTDHLTKNDPREIVRYKAEANGLVLEEVKYNL